MQELPFQIPQSLRSYIEQFDTAPEKTLKKLKQQVRKRGFDAVGHFLLAWFYHLEDKPGEAVNHALAAKNYAPGSPLMEHLHYFLLHPEKFEAHVPEQKVQSADKKMLWASRISPVLDLDRLIGLLSEVESTRIQIPEEGSQKDTVDLSENAAQVDDIASETLAIIHEKQGNRKQALLMYEKLISKNPDKKKQYAKKIKELKANKGG